MILKSLRSLRIADIAMFDVIASILGLYFLFKYLIPNHPPHFYWSWAFVLTFPLGIIFHVIFNTPTMLNYYLGLSEIPQR